MLFCVKMTIKALDNLAKGMPTGWKSQVMMASKTDGRFIEIDGAKLASINRKFQGFGLGDVLEILFKPFAIIFGLTGCGACARRKAYLNAKFRFLTWFRKGKTLRAYGGKIETHG